MSAQSEIENDTSRLPLISLESFGTSFRALLGSNKADFE